MKQFLMFWIWSVWALMFVQVQGQTFLQLDHAYVPNRIIIRFEDPLPPGASGLQTGILQVDEYIRLYRISAIQPVFPFMPFPKHPEEHSLRKAYYFFFDSGQDPQRIARAFNYLPGVAYAEPEYIYGITGIPDDPQYDRQKFFGWIKAEEAWDLTRGSDGNVVIAIVDGGTDWRHEDLIDNVWTNPDEIPANGIDDDHNGFVDDLHGWNFPHNHPDPTGPVTKPESANHGTHVSGIAGARTNNNIGVSSLSWNCKFMPINASDATGDRVIAYGLHGILYASLNGAQIINCSFGGRGKSWLWQEVIDFVTQRGSLVVAAAGNSTNNNDLAEFFPAGYNHVLSVGATDLINDTIASYSNYGISVDVFAAGSYVRSTITGNSYASFVGTSMASPVVAALAALVKTRYPGLSPDQIAERIRQTSDDIHTSNIEKADSVGRGRINALRALQPLQSPGIRVLKTEITQAGTDQIINKNDTVNLAVTVINYLEAANPTFFQLQTISPGIDWIADTYMLSSLDGGERDTLYFVFAVDSVLSLRKLSFYLHFSDSLGYEDVDFFTLEAERDGPQVLTHRTDSITFSITSKGNLGWFGQENSAGVGWNYQGDQLLFEAGVVLGNGPDHILRTIRLDSSGTQAHPFIPDEPLGIFESNSFNEMGIVSYIDSTHTFTNPLQIEQLSLVGFPENPELENSAMVVYNLVNLGRNPIRNMTVGIFADWNINADHMDAGRVDSLARWIRISDLAESPGRMIVMHGLSEQYDFRGGLLTENGILAGGFNDDELWSYLKGGVHQPVIQDENLSAIVGAGPINIPVFDQVEVGFLITAASEQAFVDRAHKIARRIYKRNFRPLNPAPPVGIEEEISSNPIRLRLFPNPFHERLNIQFELTEATDIQISLYDRIGRKISTIYEGKKSPGGHLIHWEGKRTSGLYWIRWESPAYQMTLPVFIN